MSNTQYNRKHLTIADRIFIEQALDDRLSIKTIGFHLSKHPTTISKEIKRNRILSRPRKEGAMVACSHSKNCRKNDLCGGTCSGRCSKCIKKNCLKICGDYTPKACNRTQKSPHVCNGCTKPAGCLCVRYYYRAKVADSLYQQTLKSAREGIHLTPEELNALDRLVSPAIFKGQPLTHIYVNHSEEIPCSQRTLYNYIEKQYLAAKNIDLRRKVTYKPRKKKTLSKLVNQTYHEGRSYEDFLLYVEKVPSSIVEMDTVHGKKGSGNVLLTFLFRSCSVMLAFLMEANSQDCVKGVIDELEQSLGLDLFKKVFPVILTDNGSEFKNAAAIETNDAGEPRTKVFYCDPYQSGQKGRLEKNHEFIRYFVPKGKSFQPYSQTQITTMINHINSTARASLNGHTPYQLAHLLLDPILFEKLSLIEMEPDDVHLKSDLFMNR